VSEVNGLGEPKDTGPLDGEAMVQEGDDDGAPVDEASDDKDLTIGYQGPSF